MDDVRLDAGRHHLGHADQALSVGDWAQARSHYESALLQFRGPDLMLGEGHALRGLASVELGRGSPSDAERRLREAIAAYRGVRSVLDQVDDAGVASQFRQDAMEGEAIARVLLGELLLRTGREAEAREARDWARAALDAVGSNASEAALWALTGRLAMRDGETEEAGHAYSRALALQEASGDDRGQATMLRALAEVSRLEGELDAARGYLKRALEVGQRLGDVRIQARSLAGLGSVARQSNALEDAERAYTEVLRLSTDNDAEMAGFAHLNLGELHSRAGTGDAVEHLRQAISLLGGLGVAHAVGAALHHASAHAIRLRQHDLALAAAEGARRTWRATDPVRGVGQALRLQVKALAGMKRWRDVLAVAEVRSQLAGGLQPKAIEVRAFYRARSEPEWLVEVDGMAATERFADAERRVGEVLEPLLTRNGWALSDLGSVRVALALLDRIRSVGTDPALRSDDLEELPAEALQVLPPEEDFFVIVDDPDGELRAAPPGDG